MKPIKSAVVGLGYWGPNLVRNISACPQFELAALIDRDPQRRAKLAAIYPAAEAFESLEEACGRVDLGFVAIATPVSAHAQLALTAIKAGCHVLVEKPFTATLAEARQVLASAEAAERQIFVDHTFLFTGAVQVLKQQLDSGKLGELNYVDSVRINLGLFQPDVDVLWDLAPHDISILQHLIGKAPTAVRAMGASHNPRDFADVAYLHLEYGDNFTAHIHVSWLSPVKVRRIIFAGTKQFAIYDDLEPAEKVKIYDHGVDFDVSDLEARREVLVSYRRGDMRAPNLPPSEALAAEFSNIGRTLAGEVDAAATGKDGAAVVAVLEAASRSLAGGGCRVEVEAL